MNTKKLDTSDKEALKVLYENWFPVGSGPLAAMRLICEFIEDIANRDGWIEELTPIRKKFHRS